MSSTHIGSYCRDFPETHTAHYMRMHYKLYKRGVMCGVCSVIAWCVMYLCCMVWHLLGFRAYLCLCVWCGVMHGVWCSVYILCDVWCVQSV